MNDIQKQIKEALRLISIIPVSGDAVDVMAAARINLKAAFDAAGKDCGQEGGGNG